jgi:hypothetical protein
MTTAGTRVAKSKSHARLRVNIKPLEPASDGPSRTVTKDVTGVTKNVTKLTPRTRVGRALARVVTKNVTGVTKNVIASG